jgi:hypothetical protein
VKGIALRGPSRASVFRLTVDERPTPAVVTEHGDATSAGALRANREIAIGESQDQERTVDRRDPRGLSAIYALAVTCRLALE